VFYAVVVVVVVVVEEMYDEKKLIQTFQLPRHVLVVVVCIDLDLGIMSYRPYYYVLLMMMMKIVAVVEEIGVA
jgi:hypothetical protein